MKIVSSYTNLPAQAKPATERGRAAAPNGVARQGTGVAANDVASGPQRSDRPVRIPRQGDLHALFAYNRLAQQTAERPHKPTIDEYV